MKLILRTSVVVFLLISGCARVTATRYELVETQQGGKTVTKYKEVGEGFESFRPEPYLLVKHTGAKDKPTEVEVVYLPNYDHLTETEQKPGIGNSSMTLNFNGSMLTSVSTAQDSQIDELVTALGTPLSSIAGSALSAGATLGSAGITGIAGIITEGIKLIGTFAGGAGAEAGDPCALPTTPTWVTDAETALALGTMSIESPQVQRAVLWSYMREAGRLLNLADEFLDANNTLPRTICAATNSLLTSVASLDFNDRVKVTTYLQSVEAVDADVKKLRKPDEIRKQIEKVRAILMAQLSGIKKPATAFELYKIGAGGELTKVFPL